MSEKEKVEKKDKNIIHVELTPDKEVIIAEQIEQGMAKIYEKRQEIDFDKQVQRNVDYYEGIIDPNKWGPWEGSAKYFMQMIAAHVDIIATKALRQSIGIHPIIQLEPKDDMPNPEVLRNREDDLDYILRSEIKIDKLLKAGVYREACVQGVSFVKICHTNQTESITYNQVYKPEQKEDYLLDAWNKHKHNEETIEKNVATLESGEELFVRVDEERTIHYGPKAYRVAVKDLYLRPDIHDLTRQRLIAEKLNYTWKDIQERIDSGYFRKKAVEQIKSKNEDTYFERDYTLFECILYAKLDNKFQRFVITYEPDSKSILRAIHYPYKHGKIYYIPYYIKERDDSVYGYSIVDMLADSTDYVNDLLNGMLDRSSLDNNPVLRIPAGAKLGAHKWGPNAWIPSDTSIDVLSAQNRSIEDVRILGVLRQIAETVDGVSADILSGQVASNDPTAPAAKQAMQTQESNLRIEEYIINLQFGNELLAEQVEELKKQYAEEYNKVLDVPVMYTAHGTTLSINNAQQLAIIKDYVGMVGMLAPEVLQDAKWRRIILTLYINSLGGMIEKKKAELLPEEIGGMPIRQGQVNMEGAVSSAIDGMTPEEQAALEESINEMRGK